MDKTELSRDLKMGKKEDELKTTLLWIAPYHPIPSFYRLWGSRLLKKNIGKVENAGNQHFLLFR